MKYNITLYIEIETENKKEAEKITHDIIESLKDDWELLTSSIYLGSVEEEREGD